MNQLDAKQWGGKTEQCFCPSVWNDKTRKIENCTCGKCAHTYAHAYLAEDWIDRVERVQYSKWPMRVLGFIVLLIIGWFISLAVKNL